MKQRFSKRYRHPTLDARLTQQRARAEARAVARARRLGVRCPALYHVDVESSTIVMERLRGRPLREVLRELQRKAVEEATRTAKAPTGTGTTTATVTPTVAPAVVVEAATFPSTAPRVHSLMRSVGEVVARLHDGGMIHGDLTTLNLFVMDDEDDGGDVKLDDDDDTKKDDGDEKQQQPKPPVIAVIDFGLSSHSTLPEDRGVDLYVLERALGAAHADAGPLFEPVEASYRQHSRGWAAALARFREVRLRGRKRSMVG